MDVGTGDGKAVLRRAPREPKTLFVGIDAAAGPMVEASRRAARAAGREGAGNALFVVAAAESLPGPFAGRAHEVTVALPWGSLLRGLACAEPQIVEPVAGLLRAGGRLEMLLSVAEADAATGLPLLDERNMLRVAEAHGAFNLECVELRRATAADVERLSSSWARRLAIPSRRSGWLLRLALHR